MASQKPPPRGEAPGALASLADVFRKQGVTVRDESGAASEPAIRQPVVDDGAPNLSRAGKVVVRRERKGHGGKTVTVIEGLAVSASHLETVARTMRKAFGCGSRVDGGRVVLQGDLVSAAESWLRAHGASRITIGN